MLDFLTLLRENPYPGRGILVSCLLYTSLLIGIPSKTALPLFQHTQQAPLEHLTAC